MCERVNESVCATEYRSRPSASSNMWVRGFTTMSSGWESDARTTTATTAHDSTTRRSIACSLFVELTRIHHQKQQQQQRQNAVVVFAETPKK